MPHRECVEEDQRFSTVYRKETPAHLMTAAQLQSLGKQPGDPRVTEGLLERVFEGDVWRTTLYDLRSAKPLPNSASRPVPPVTTPRAAASATPSSWSDAAVWARDVLEGRDAVVLDTELTDFTGRVIEIAVLATDGTVVLSTLVDTEGTPINHHAQREHGITVAMLAGAPTMAQVWPRLEEVLEGRTVIAWNAPFGPGAVARRTSAGRRRHGAAGMAATTVGMCDASARRLGRRVKRPGRRYRTHKLEGGHRAQGDCRAVLDRLRQMASPHGPRSE
ncbi:3'-5' exonuclease [Saccharothrix xinjiangensis]|uniref:3'-5' exonuclease n=1 Tax=Saccharothrix xinjiangensis TaxID=204798 RepID=A0ABV9Y170_9PSEU